MIDRLTKIAAAMVRPTAVRVATMIVRGVVDLVDDDATIQRLQVKVGDGVVREGVERFQPYGFTSVPKKGAECVVVALGGRSDHMIAVVVDDRTYRLKGLENGEVAMYTDEEDQIVIRRGGTIEIKAATEIAIDAPLVSMTGDLEVAGEVTGNGIALSTHVHPKGGLAGTSACTAGGTSITVTGNTGAPQ